MTALWIALVGMTLLCIIGWVKYWMSLDDRIVAIERANKAELVDRSSIHRAVPFVRFLQHHPHLLPEAIVEHEWFGWQLNTDLQKEVEAAEKRVAQHERDLKVLRKYKS